MSRKKYACKMPHEMSAEVNMQNSVETFAKCNMDKIGGLLWIKCACSDLAKHLLDYA